MEKISKSLVSWASILDEKTREQAITTAKLPFIYPHIALMPDAHLDVIWTRCKQLSVGLSSRPRPASWRPWTQRLPGFRDITPGTRS